MHAIPTAIVTNKATIKPMIPHTNPAVASSHTTLSIQAILTRKNKENDRHSVDNQSANGTQHRIKPRMPHTSDATAIPLLSPCTGTG